MRISDMKELAMNIMTEKEAVGRWWAEGRN
jgi:hypothetical protein